MKKDGDRWTVISPVDARADEAAVGNLLSAVADYKYERVVASGKLHWPKFGIGDSKRRIELTLNGASRPLVVYVGDKTPVGYSLYTGISTSDSVFVGSQYFLSSTDKELHDFRDKILVDLDETKLRLLSEGPPQV